MFGDDQRDEAAWPFSLTTPVAVVAEHLKLTPHPEGGWFRRVWTAEWPLVPSIGHSPTAVETPDRSAASAILFLLARGPGSAWHRLHGSEELWLWRAGQPLLLHTGGFGESPEDGLIHRVDNSAAAMAGVLIARQQWQRASVVGDGWTLVTCVVCPEFDVADFELWATPSAATGVQPASPW